MSVTVSQCKLLTGSKSSFKMEKGCFAAGLEEVAAGAAGALIMRDNESGTTTQPIKVPHYYFLHLILAISS